MMPGAALGIAQPNINPVGYFNESQRAAQQEQALALQQKQQGLQGLYMFSAGMTRNGDPDPAEWEQGLDWMEQSGVDPKVIGMLRGKPQLAKLLASGSAEALKFSQDERALDLQLRKLELELQKAAAGPDAPKVETFYDETTGREVKRQWNPEIGDWEVVGGVKAPSDPLVTVDMGGGTSRSKFQTELGGLQAKRYDAAMTEAQAARTAIGTLSMMEQAVEDPGFYSGFGGPQVMELKRLAAAIGIDPEGVDSMEAFNALSKQAALAAMGGSLGTGFSNADRDFVEQQVPNLANTPEGNRKLIQIQKAIAERKVQIAELATEYVNEHGVLDANFDRELATWAEANPLFGGAGGGQAGGGEVVDWTEFF
jgi:hypothetical protein